ncbi:MAG: S-methyl-5-thioribose-1-phosphate isomerase [Candidatus Methylopumilus sp.]|nr:S-methyl-5-thioribose-1-phosphate isomerase [Candidatus Methylopumilus sp.]
MKVNGKHFQTIWPDSNEFIVHIIDQTKLPHHFITRTLHSLDEAINAIKIMQVRGAPLIGVTAAYGIALAMKNDPSDDTLKEASLNLFQSRPTAINLQWALDRMNDELRSISPGKRFDVAWSLSQKMLDEDVATNQSIGKNGLNLIEGLLNKKTLQILTHCNAGWLATVDHGTALSPIYYAHEKGINLHVWVDETRPRNQGAHLTTWELAQQNIPHTLISDNTGGYLMQKGEVDLVIVGADRVSMRGDVCNKIGTYLKAIAAYENNIPFYVAAPSSTIDKDAKKNFFDIPIESRHEEEVLMMQGLNQNNELTQIQIAPHGTRAYNPAFDITPHKYVTKIITEDGIYSPQELESIYSQ